MSYEILQFNLGTGQAQGFVLAGREEHEGSNANLTPEDMWQIVGKARQWGREHGYRVKNTRSLLIDPENIDGPEVISRVAAELDRLFLKAHAEQTAHRFRAALELGATQP